MSEDDRSRRKTRRLNESEGTASRRSGTKNSTIKNKSGGEWIWLVVGMGIVLLAGVLFLLFYNSESAKTEPVTEAAVEKTAAKTESSGAQNHGDANSVERSLALRILNLGGRVTVLESGVAKEIYQADALPAGDFEIDAVRLDGIDAASDTEVASLADLRSMRELGLSKTKVTDAGLASLQKSAALSSLNLRGCAISDQGLMTLSKMSGLRMIVADGGVSGMSTVRDFGLSSSPQLPAALPAAGSALSDKGIESLAALKGLETLSLVSSQAGDSSLAAIADSSRKLVQLRTVGFGITDGGVSSLKNLTNLRVLELSNSLITDKCIDSLSQLKWLEYLVVQGTQITPDGVRKLQERLPNCRVFGGQYDPRLNIIREVLVLGGKVTIVSDGSQPFQVVSFDKLPEKFAVKKIDLSEVRQLWLDDFAIPEVTELVLTDSGVSPSSIRRLHQLFPNLQSINLAGTAIGNGDIAGLSSYASLMEVDLTRTGVTEVAGLALQKQRPDADVFWGILPPSPDAEAAKWIISVGGTVQIEMQDRQLRSIQQMDDLPSPPFRLRQINGTASASIKDSEIGRLTGLRYLRQFEAPKHSLTDAGLEVFTTMPRLHWIWLSFPSGDGITDEGMSVLSKLPNLSFLHLGGISISPDGLRQLGYREDLLSLNLDDNNTDLWIKSWKHTVTDEAAEVIADQFPNLVHLEMSRGKLTDFGVEKLMKLSKLAALWIQNNERSDFSRITDHSAKMIATLPALHVLSLSGQGVTDATVEHLSKASSLKDLSLNGTTVSDNCLENLMRMPSLTRVDLRNTAVTERGLRKLQEARPTLKIEEPYRVAWLRGLIKTGAKVTIATESKQDVSLTDIEQLPRGDFLIQTVDYSNNKGRLTLPDPWTNIDAIEINLANAVDFHGGLLEGISHCRGLQKLDVSNTYVVDDHLVRLYIASTLRQLILTGTKCTPAGVAKLRAALPQCEIIGP